MLLSTTAALLHIPHFTEIAGVSSCRRVMGKPEGVLCSDCQSSKEGRHIMHIEPVERALQAVIVESCCRGSRPEEVLKGLEVYFHALDEPTFRPLRNFCASELKRSFLNT